MQLRHFLVAPVLMVGLAACHSDDVTVNARPPLGAVRFINAVPDGGPVDIRYIDQVEWSGSSVNGTNIGLAYRASTIHWPTEAKARRIRVFPSDSNITVASTILLDTTITVEANKRITLLLVGSRAPDGRVSFVTIDDEAPTLTGQQIAIRMVNAGGPGAATVPASGWTSATTVSALGPFATWADLGPYQAGAYVVRDTGAFAIRAAEPDRDPIFASAAAPAGTVAEPGIAATAGFRGAGSVLSAYLFPRSVAGSTAPQTAPFQNPALIYFVDEPPPAPRTP